VWRNRDGTPVRGAEWLYDGRDGRPDSEVSHKEDDGEGENEDDGEDSDGIAVVVPGRRRLSAAIPRMTAEEAATPREQSTAAEELPKSKEQKSVVSNNLKTAIRLHVGKADNDGSGDSKGTTKATSKKRTSAKVVGGRVTKPKPGDKRRPRRSGARKQYAMADVDDDDDEWQPSD
jgi:hypothetical protein